MRVLIDYRAALRERSGVGEYTHELTRALLRAGGAHRDGDAAGMMSSDTPDVARPGGPLDVTLFSSSWKDRLAPAGDSAGASVVDRRVPVKVLNFAWHRLEWPPVEMLTGAAFDVVHSFHPLLMPARRAAQVITIYDLNFLKHPDRTRAEIRRDYAALAADHARRADHVIVISQFTAREVEHLLSVPADRISVCAPGAPAWAPRAGPRPTDGYVLFFGTLEPRKNVGLLLDAYEHLAARRRDVPPLVLAGKATEQSAAWLERIQRPPLKEIVRHIGYVEPGGRRSVYEGARLLVQPSFEEGFGLPVVEAMTVGVPVVATNRGALPEVLGDAGILVDADNPDGLAAAIERMLDDEPFAAAAAVKGQARARLFTWEQAAHNTIAAYRLALEHRAQRRGAA